MNRLIHSRQQPGGLGMEAYCPHCNLTSPPGDHQRTTSQALKLTHGHMIHNPYQETKTSDWTMWGRNGNEPFYREDGDVL